MRYFVLTRAGRKLEDGAFFFSTRGLYERFQHAVLAAQSIWKTDERSMREYTDRCFFIISEHMLIKVGSHNTTERQTPLRSWYWCPLEDHFFYPYETK